MSVNVFCVFVRFECYQHLTGWWLVSETSPILLYMTIARMYSSVHAVHCEFSMPSTLPMTAISVRQRRHIFVLLLLLLLLLMLLLHILQLLNSPRWALHSREWVPTTMQWNHWAARREVHTARCTAVQQECLSSSRSHFNCHWFSVFSARCMRVCMCGYYLSAKQPCRQCHWRLYNLTRRRGFAFWNFCFYYHFFSFLQSTRAAAMKKFSMPPYVDLDKREKSLCLSTVAANGYNIGNWFDQGNKVCVCMSMFVCARAR